MSSLTTQEREQRMKLRRPRVLDLCCGSGGAAVGYYRAGFDVVGVDIVDRPNYPFEFVLDDAILYAAEHCQEFNLVHASPPCQASSALTKGTNRGREYLDMIPAVRDILRWYGVPWVIENVPGANIRRDLMLCGEMFGLGVLRHRYFEIGWTPGPAGPTDLPIQRAHVPHRGRVAGLRHGRWYEGPYFAVYGEGGGKGTVPQWQQAMGIDWTSVRKEIAESIPPAYSEYIGREFITTAELGAAIVPDPDERLALLARPGAQISPALAVAA